VSEEEAVLAGLEAAVRRRLAARLGQSRVAAMASDADFELEGVDSVDLLAAVAELERDLAVQPQLLEPLDRACVSIAATARYLRRSSGRGVAGL